MEYAVRYIKNRLYETQQELYNTSPTNFVKVNSLIKERKKLKSELKKINILQIN